MKIFVDTSIFIALLVSSETDHQKVRAAYEDYKRKRVIFFTSDYILDELFTRIVYDFGKSFVNKVIKITEKAIKEDELKLLRVDSLIFLEALRLFTKYAEHRLSFTDATSAVFLRELKLDEIFTLDSDFKKLRL